jgi:hypothetical protein
MLKGYIKAERKKQGRRTFFLSFLLLVAYDTTALPYPHNALQAAVIFLIGASAIGSLYKVIKNLVVTPRIVYQRLGALGS